MPDASLKPETASPFTDRVVWVTGAASGMGTAQPVALPTSAQESAVYDASPSVVDVAEEIEAGGGVAAGVIADVTDTLTVSAAARELESRLGPAEVAVLGAGVAGSATPIAELDLAEWERVIAVNLSGVFLTMQAAIPHCAKRAMARSS